MPSAVGCEHHVECSWIDLAYTEVKEAGWNGVGDGQCKWNTEEQGSEEKVGQNAPMFHQLLYASWPRVLVRDVLWLNGEQ